MSPMEGRNRTMRFWLRKESARLPPVVAPGHHQSAKIDLPPSLAPLQNAGPGPPVQNAMDATLDSESLFLVVDFLRCNPMLAPVAAQLEALIAENDLLGRGRRWDGSLYVRSYEDMIRKFPLASNILRSRFLQSGENNNLCPSWINLAPPRIFPADSFFRRIQNRSGKQRLRLCPPTLYGRYRHIKTIYGHHGPVFCVAFDRTGKRVITGSDDHRVKIWRTCDGALEFSLLGHTAPISDIAVSLCNLFVGSASSDGTVRLWYLRDGTLIRIIHLNSEVTRLIFHPEYVICTNMDGCTHALRLIDAASHDVLTAPRPIEPPASCEALSVAMSPCRQCFAVGYSNGHVGFFLVEHLAAGFMSPFTDVDISSAGEIVAASFNGKQSEESPPRVAVGSHTGKFHVLSRNDAGLFDIQHVLVHSEVRQHASTTLVVVLAWSSDDSKLVTTYHNSIHVWCTISGELLFHRSVHENGSDILSMSVHPLYKDALFTVSVNGSAIISSLIDGSEIVRFPATDIYQLIDCSFSPNADFICATSDLGRLVLFGTGSRRRHVKLPDAQFFTFENRVSVMNLDELPPRVLCDAEFEVYRSQPRHLSLSHIAHDFTEAGSDVDSDVSEVPRPQPMPLQYVDFDDVSFDPHVAVPTPRVSDVVERRLSEEESFSMTSETENEEEDDIDEALSDEDLESFQFPVNMDIDSERRAPNTRRTRRRNSDSDSDRPLRRRHRIRIGGEPGIARNSDPVFDRRARRRLQRRQAAAAAQIRQTPGFTNSILRPRRLRTFERTVSQQTVQSDRSSVRRDRTARFDGFSAPAGQPRTRRSVTEALTENEPVPIRASPPQRRVMPRRQQVESNQQANPSSVNPTGIRTRSSFSNASNPIRMVQPRILNAGASRPGPVTRRSSRAVSYSNRLSNDMQVHSAPANPSRVRTRSSLSSSLSAIREVQPTFWSVVESTPTSRRSSRLPYSDQPIRLRRQRAQHPEASIALPAISNSVYNTRMQSSLAAATGSARITRHSQMVVEETIALTTSPRSTRSLPEPAARRSTRHRRSSPSPRRTRFRSESTGSDVPLRHFRRRRQDLVES